MTQTTTRVMTLPHDRPYKRSERCVFYWLVVFVWWSVSQGAGQAELGGSSEMTNAEVNTLFDKNFPVMIAKVGADYLQARDQLLKLGATERAHLLERLETLLTNSSDWEEKVSAETLRGWLNNATLYQTCLQYMQGNLPGIVPLPGFTAQHRAKAIATLGTEITPRILEILRKTHEDKNDTEQAALFGALIYLKDINSLEPMLALMSQQQPPAIRSQTIGVLAVLDDPKGLAALITIILNPEEAEELRTRAIRALARFSAPESSSVLMEVLTAAVSTLEEKQAAADALHSKGDPVTRSAVVTALSSEQDYLLQATLIQTLGRVGASEDIALLENISEKGDIEIQDYVRFAIEEIRGREKE